MEPPPASAETQARLAEMGRRIRQARERAGLSEEELAERIGISGVTLHLYETGVVAAGDHLRAIAAVTGVPVSFFLEPAPTAPAPVPREESGGREEARPRPSEADALAVPSPPAAAQPGKSPPRAGPSPAPSPAERMGPGPLAETVARREQELHEREAALKQREESLAGERRRLGELEERLRRRLEELEAAAAELVEREHALAVREEALTAREEEVAQAVAATAADDEERARRGRQLDEQRAAVASLQEELARERARLQAWERDLVAREQTVERREAEVAAQERSPAPAVGPEAEVASTSGSALDTPGGLLPPGRRQRTEAVPTPPGEEVEGDEESRLFPPLRTGGALAASLALTGLDNIASLHQIGGNSVIVATYDGRQVRVTACRDGDTGGFSSTYEVARAEQWHGRDILVWEQAEGYPPRLGDTIEDCLEAALAEVDRGEQPAERRQQEEGEVENGSAVEPGPAAGSRQGRLGWRRRRR